MVSLMEDNFSWMIVLSPGFQHRGNQSSTENYGQVKSGNRGCKNFLEQPAFTVILEDKSPGAANLLPSVASFRTTNKLLRDYKFF